MKFVVLALLVVAAFSAINQELVADVDYGCQAGCPEGSMFNEHTWKCEKVSGSIDNCMYYEFSQDHKNSIVSCNTCEEGFETVSTYNGVNVCRAVGNRIANCKSQDDYNFETGRCTQCADGYVWVKAGPTDSSFVSCQAATNIANCKVYAAASSGSAIEASGVATAVCSECKEGFQGANCDAVTVVENCETYDNSAAGSGACTQCKAGFLAQTAGQDTCTALTALDNCAYHEYSTGQSKVECARCSGNFYVKDGACVAIPSTGVAVTENCAMFGSDGAYVYCSQCAVGFESLKLSWGLECMECPTKASSVGASILSVSIAVIAVLFALL